MGQLHWAATPLPVFIPFLYVGILIYQLFVFLSFASASGLSGRG